MGKFAILFIVFASCMQVAGAVTAQETAPPIWDFSGPRQPTYDQFRPTNDGRCPQWLDATYEAYATLHPKFRPIMNEPGMRARWRRSSIIHNNGDSGILGFCFFEKLFRIVMSGMFSKKYDRVLHCGIIAPNLDKNELRIAEAAHELTEYASIGIYQAAHKALILGSEESVVALNPDVRYYLQQVLNRLVPPQDSWRELLAQHFPPDMGQALSPERRRFVDDAFERGDYRAVLATTEPCPQLLPKPEPIPETELGWLDYVRFIVNSILDLVFPTIFS